jgi:hypothetical protein
MTFGDFVAAGKTIRKVDENFVWESEESSYSEWLIHNFYIYLVLFRDHEDIFKVHRDQTGKPHISVEKVGWTINCTWLLSCYAEQSV